MGRWWSARHVLAGWQKVQVVERVHEILGLDKLGIALLLQGIQLCLGKRPVEHVMGYLGLRTLLQ